MRESLLFNLILFAVVALASCSPAENGEVEEEEAIRVRTEEVTKSEVDEVAWFTGTIQPFYKNHISPANPGRIDEIFVKEGDRVSEGELLVQMDETQLHDTRVQLNELERELARLDTLLEVGSVSQQEYDRVENQHERIKANYENLLRNTQLRSPVDGFVTGRFFDDGEMFTGSPTTEEGKTAILTVEKLNPLKVFIDISEVYFPRVEKNMGAKINLDIYPDNTFEGTVYNIHPTIDRASRTFTIEVKVYNDDFTVRPGMFSRVGIDFGKQEMITVPDVAVMRQRGTDDRYVFVVEDGIAKRRTVETGRLGDEKIAIHGGVEVGEELVVAGQARLIDESAVIVEE